ncbi:MAG TPA: hypothetical protein PK958_03700 [Rhodocyclaceae bacterium]|nr:hypothetical protein [Rhodocyclaceae bacterium]
MTLVAPGWLMRTTSFPPIEKLFQFTIAEPVLCWISMFPVVGRETVTFPTTTCSPVGSAQTGIAGAKAMATAKPMAVGRGAWYPFSTFFFILDLYIPLSRCWIRMSC